MLRTAFVTLSLAAAAFGQTAPAFDVASVRVSPPGKGGGEGMKHDMRTGVNVQVSPDGVTIRNSNLRSIVCWAHKVFEFQVKGPDWLGSERYDINAKASAAADDEKLRLMMQTLLAERFKMATHSETKEMQAYLLQIAKGGLKVKESTAGDGEMDITPNQQTMSVTVVRAGVPQLIDALSNIFRAPVIDQTGLTGKYDATFNMMKYLAEMKAADPNAPLDPQTLIIRGLQEELGLKVEPKKMAVDLVVVDRAEKVPVAN